MKSNHHTVPALRTNRIPVILSGSAFLFFAVSALQAQTSYTSTSATGAWNTNRWNNAADGPAYTGPFTANNNVSFTSGTYSFAGMGAATNVGNVTVASGVTVTFASNSGTYATGGAVRTIDVGAGGLFDLNGNAFSTAAGTGLIKSGDGVFGTGAGTFAGGFTLNAGTVIARGTTGLGSGGANTLTLNGGTLASNGTRTFDNTRFGGGIVIGGNVQFGELSTVVGQASSSANLSFANGVSLGGVTRTFTQGNNGTQTFSGVISNSGSGGLTFAANVSADGRFELTNTANTFTGDININGGEVRFTGDGSMGNAANDIIVDGGRLAKLSDSATVTLSAGRNIFVGDGVGTAISSPGSGTLIYNNAIANKTGEIGSWAKQGGGVLELGGVSTYTGDTAINNGTVRLTIGNDRLPTGTVLNVGQAGSANLGTLDLNGRNQTIAGLNSVTGLNTAVANNTITSATAATLTISGSGTYGYGDGTNANSGVISGAVSVVKEGAGRQSLGDVNTYTGTTTINGGTLQAAGEDALGGTTSIAIAAGGTLLLSNTATTDRLNDSAAIIMNGGSLAFSGNVTEGSSPGTGALTLSSSSFIDFANGDASINFGASSLATWASGATLSIWNWGGSTVGGGNDQLLFGIDSSSLSSGQLGQIQFFSGAGTGFLGTGMFAGSLGEVVPVPEPASTLSAAFLLGLAGWRERHRRRVRARAGRQAAVCN